MLSYVKFKFKWFIMLHNMRYIPALDRPFTFNVTRGNYATLDYHA